jgi:glycosyltransferase involved in cell wall biosynthesis
VKSLLLIQNYPPARQYSILTYGTFIASAAARSCERVRSWHPKGVFHRWAARTQKGRRFLDLDKYLVAPFECLFLQSDVTHISDNSNAWQGLISRQKILSVTCHDMIAWLAINEGMEGWTPGRFTKLLNRVNMAGLRKADRIVAGSKTTREVMIRAGIDPAKIVVIYYPILQEFPAEGRLPAGVDPDKLARAFLHFGAGKYPKNTPAAIAAIEALAAQGRTDIYLALVGEEAADIAAKSSVPDQIIPLANLTTAEIVGLYRHCAGVLMPSRYEGFGLPVIEAQSYGCPVIGSDGGGLVEVMGEGAPTLLPNPPSIPRAAELMVRLIEDAAFRQTVVTYGEANTARFDRQKSSDTYAAYFGELCGMVASPKPEA